MPPTFHIARSNRHTPNFSGVSLPLTWCHLLAYSSSQSQETQTLVRLKRSFWGCFWTKSIFLAKLSTFACSTSYISRKMWYGIFLVRLVRRQNANTLQLYFTPDLTHSYLFIGVWNCRLAQKLLRGHVLWGGLQRTTKIAKLLMLRRSYTALQGFILY